MSTVDVLLVNLAALGAAMTCLWVISLVKSDVSIVDIFWGTGFVLVAWLTFLLTGDGSGGESDASGGDLLIVVLTTAWGGRLSLFLAWRNLGKGEDYRYRAMRRRMGDRFRWVSAVTVFGLQGVLVWIVSLPLQISGSGGDSPEWTWMRVAGLVLWVIGITFETVGDLQLARFKARPDSAGKIMDRGLWRYTRHPNYFGDFMVWWGLFAVAMATPAGLWANGWTIIGPAVMSFLLIRVSGVALLEKALVRRRPGYEDYIRRTSAFFPWPPRDDTSTR